MKQRPIRQLHRHRWPDFAWPEDEPTCDSNIIMKPTTKLCLLSIIAIFFASCGEKKATQAETPEQVSQTNVEQELPSASGDTLESLTDELVVQLHQYADTVLSVQDEPTAQEAVSKLDGIAKAIGNIAGRMSELETPDDATNVAVDEKMKNAGLAIKEKMQSAGQTLSDPKIAAILIPAMQKFGIRMAEHEKTFMRFSQKKKQASPSSESASPESTTEAQPESTQP